MATCTVRWRPSGGRGEFEYVPADTLADRMIDVFFQPLNLTIPAEVMGVRAQGKPRLRKIEKDNRRKLHLPQLVMAVARLPQPARQDLTHSVAFPLENQAFVMDSMDFDIIEDDGITTTLAPLRVSVLHSSFEIDLQDRFQAIAEDLAGITSIRSKHPLLADAVEAHGGEIAKGVNDLAIRTAANKLIAIQASIFGKTNAGSAIALEEASNSPETELEEQYVAIEGRLLARMHVYKERDRKLGEMVRSAHRRKHGGKLICEGCDLDPAAKYGLAGERSMEAHHKVPVEELQPDSVTRVVDMSLLCAACHRVVHSQRPCLTLEELRTMIESNS